MNFPISLPIVVAWGDMDAFGHVNNTVFFRYFESTRIAYMEAVEAMHPGDFDFTPVVASARCDFLASVVYPDTVVGQTRVLKMGNSSFTMDYQLISQAQGKPVARGEAVIVNVDRTTGRARPLPTSLRQRVCELEGRDFAAEAVSKEA
jgi:acyl-CoA thioester hydrolase